MLFLLFFVLFSLKVWFEPTDPNLAGKILQLSSSQLVTYASPNLAELRIMTPSIPILTNSRMSTESIIKECLERSHLLIPHLINTLVVTLGENGVLIISGPGEKDWQYFPAQKVLANNIESTSGAGDCFSAGMISGLLEHSTLELSSDRLILEKAVRKGMQAAVLSLQSKETVPGSLRNLRRWWNRLL